MADVELDQISKVYDNGFRAVDNLSLDIGDGEFLVLVGPSGCGKSTALRMVAGLEDISEGELRIGGRRVNEVPPRERDIAMVFQSYALYPHMSVADNISFGLSLRKMPKDEINQRVKRAADILGLRDLLDRRPKMLSGGQRQRVAMGRAIVRDPQVFLMDEPLSNLDAKLRVQMRSEIARLQHDMGVTTVYVTHDQVEAMTMADRVAVMRKGVLQQVAAPHDLYERPANLFVAGFIGSPSMNLLEATVERRDSGGLGVAIGPHRLSLGPGALAAYPRVADHVGDTVIMGIRPEFFSLPGDVVADDQQIEVTARLVESMGSEVHIHFEVPVPPVDTEDTRELAEHDDTGGIPGSDGTVVVARVDGIARISVGDHVRLRVQTDRCHFFERTSGEPLR